jgi:hemerythrin superfamily protein
MKATELLKKQHRSVHGLFGELKKLDGAARRTVMDRISAELAHHMAIEEGIFYPAVRQLDTKKTQEMVPEALEEHHVLKLVLAELPRVDPKDERFEAKMTVLAEIVEHHVAEEEKEMFKAAEKLGDDRLRLLGDQMESGALVDAGSRRGGKKRASAPPPQGAEVHSPRHA